jgi:hypothetical protein
LITNLFERQTHTNRVFVLYYAQRGPQNQRKQGSTRGEQIAQMNETLHIVSQIAWGQ